MWHFHGGRYPVGIVCTALLGLWLSGCGGSGTQLSSATNNTARARVSITWPTKTTRLIPVLTNSITIDITNSDLSFHQTQTVDRPFAAATSTVVFDMLSVGELLFAAGAYAHSGATGTQLATAKVWQAMVAGQYVDVTINMNSTISSLVVTPSSVTLDIGQSQALVLSAQNYNTIVPISPSSLQWVSADSTVATVSGNGTVTAVARGNTTITVTETESGVSATITVIVRPPVNLALGTIFYTRDWIDLTQVYSIRPDGIGAKRIPDPGRQRNFWVSASWDGTKLAVVAANGEQFVDIYVMNADGSNQRNLTNIPMVNFPGALQPPGGDNPRFSPDGRLLVFTREGQIYTMSASDGSNVTRLTHDAFCDLYPAYSPDGRKIVFSSNRDGNFHLYVMNADGTNPQQLTSNTTVAEDDDQPVYSPNGTMIAYHHHYSNMPNDSSIWIMNADGSNQHWIIWIGEQPSFSPDGTMLAFSDGADLYTITIDAFNSNTLQKITDSTSRFGSSPSWAPVPGPAGAVVTVKSRQ